MDPAEVNTKRGREAAATAPHRAMAIVHRGVASAQVVVQALFEGLHWVRTAYWLACVVGYDDAANPADTVLTAIVQFGEILERLHN
ncbi:hypothetical protein [Nocardia farcinica]|uniref:hypothetical protein n=1 Tax=Nocardia farcinica TaxID=37329 RepID=UPI0024588B27|nr:hypothetical protein [Nocardia farcinica]